MGARTRTAALLATAVVTAGGTVPVAVTSAMGATDAGPAAARPSCAGMVAGIVGTPRDDVLRGTPGRDVVVGLGGHDRISGLGGNDVVCAGPGNDVVLGGPGRDLLEGGGGKDRLESGAGTGDTLLGDGGADRLEGGAGTQHVDGGEGDDRLRGGGFADVLSGGEGDDRLEGGTHGDQLYGGPGGDTLLGGAGSDLLEGEDGQDTLDTGDGFRDEASGGPDADELTVAAREGSGDGGTGPDKLTGTADGVTLHGGEDASGDLLVGGAGTQVMHGGEGTDGLLGGAGADQLYAGDGPDSVDGGDGDDVLEGDEGDDALRGGPGHDRCTGGEGADACDGGTPGPQENTADDPDLCDAEDERSCRDDALPEAWSGLLSGVDHALPEDTHGPWSMHVRLVKDREDERWTHYRLESGTLGWSYVGSSGGCSWGDEGSHGPGDVRVLLAVDRVLGTYELSFGLDVPVPPVTWYCPEGESPGHASQYRPSGIADDQEYVAADEHLAGTVANPNLGTDLPDDEFTWSLSPDAG